MSNLKKYDKDGNPLNLVPQIDRTTNKDFHSRWLENPEKFEPSAEDIKCELQLSALGDFEPLDFTVDYKQFQKEIEPWNDKWTPYLRREGLSNDREGLLLVGLDEETYSDSGNKPKLEKQLGRKVHDIECSTPTEVYDSLACLHPLLDYFSPLGRTVLVKVNAGGWFHSHKDNPMLTRKCFRIAVFIGDSVDHESFEWDINGQRQMIKPNRAYYIDTRKTHRTHSWHDNSIHCIINIPKTWENVIKLMTYTKYK